MAIKHPTVKAPGQKLFAVADWNVNHTGTLNHQTEITNVTVDQHHAQIHASSHEVGGGDLVDHNQLTNYAANRHFLEGEISHLNILNIGTNTHAQIDTHITAYNSHDHSAADPTQVDHANLTNVTANQHHTKYIHPVGSITMYGAAAAPTGWVNCDGASLLRAGTYADLFAVIGVTYGSVDGDHFNVPNFASKFPRGNTAGATGGSDDAIVVSHTHTFTGSVMANHGHADTFAFSGDAMGTHTHTFTGSVMGTHNHSINHDHAGFSSGNQSADHTHSHTHGAIASGIQSASHKHDTVMGSHTHNVLLGVPAGGVLGLDAPFAFQFTSWKGGYVSSKDLGTKESGNQKTSHTHSTTIPAKTSGNQSVSHNHWVDVPNFTGNSGTKSAGTPAGTNSNESAGTPAGSITGSVTVASAGTPAGTNSTEGVSGTNANIPAYLGVNFIIKY